MNKFALAALGAVAARPPPHHHKTHGADFGLDHKAHTHAIETVTNWVFGESEEPKPVCNLKEGDRMDDFVFFREAVQGIINSGVKGLYHETTEARPIPEECFGDWIDRDLVQVNQWVSKVYDDWWSFTLKDAQKVSNKLIDMHYKNMDACHFERIADDKKTWCLANPEKCVGLEGLFSNLWDNSASLFSKASDLYDLIDTDDSCYSDSEIISEIERATEDVASILSTAWGFDLKWDQTRQVAHIKRRDFKKQLKSFNIEFGQFLEVPTVDDLWGYASHMELPSLFELYTYVQEALHYIGLDL